MTDRRNVVKLFAILPFLGRAPVSFAAPAEVNREEALRIALAHAAVARRDVRNLKIERGEENGVPVYKVEFETAFGDFDVAVSRRSGDVVDADCEIREEWVRRQKAVPNAQEKVRREAARRIPGARPEDVRLSRAGERWEGVLRKNGCKAEFEADRRTGILHDWNLERRD